MPSSGATDRNRRSTDPAKDPAKHPPRTARGARTRAVLVSAARTVFERDGYVDARLADITAEAKVAAGSFYTYFASKEEVFAAVLESVQEEMVHPQVRRMIDSDDPLAVIEASNRAYLLAYRRNAKLMRLLHQVGAVDENVQALRRARGQAFAERNAQSIRDLQARGIADVEVDPFLAATALSAMVSRMAYGTFVLDDPWKLDDLVTAMTRLWANALRIS